MFSRRVFAAFVMLAFALIAVTDRQFISADEEAPSDRAPLFFYIAVDNSLSYGHPKQGRRIKPAKEVFDGAKDKLYRTLIAQAVFGEGDRLVGISQFTDEPPDMILNSIQGGPIEIRPNNSPPLSVTIKESFDEISLRESQRESYKTIYRNVLNRAGSEFQKLGAAPEQQVCILLTDERGSESQGPAADSPERFSKYYIIKFQAKPEGGGALTTTPNVKLAELVNENNASVGTYLTAIRNNYRSVQQGKETGLDKTVMYLILAGILILAVFINLKVTKAQSRNWLWQKQVPQLRVSYNHDAGKILLQPKKFELPEEGHRYWLDKGGELKNLSPEEGSIEPAEELPPGSYVITVQPESGPPVTGIFEVGEEILSEAGLRATYKARGSIIFLKPHNCQLPTSKKRYEIADVEVEIESVNAEAGEVILAHPLQAGRHKIRVLLEDGREVEASFKADPPPRSTPGYAVSVARLSDIGKPRTVELTGREINLLDEKGLKASIWVKRDDHYLYIRTAGNVQKEDGTPIIGKLQLALGEVIGNPILLELEDDEEDVEIAVQKL